KNKAQALLAAARQAKDMNVLTDGGAHPLHTYLDITRRNGQGLDNTALAAAFTTPAPVDGIPSMDMVKTPSGYQILAITHVTAPSAAAINPKVAAQIRTSLEGQRSRLLSIAYLKDLREHAKVEINDAQLAQIAH
ncbi:peptidylprolyl isomerase, partial [Acidithiobacillus ferriphilus]|nr:peptidylprolyl isomerase [Acidithiobacillus ferriphilus]